MTERCDRAGQGKTEYIIIVILVALAVITAVIAYGAVIQRKTTDSSVEVINL